MNFLAHAFLSKDNKDEMLGNLFSDFYKGDSWQTLPGQVKTGIRKHRKLDAFADNHEIYLKSKKYFPGKIKRFSNIFMDMYIDHFLSLYFEKYSEKNLKHFTGYVYNSIEKSIDIFDEKVYFFARKMIENNWLMSYMSIASLEKIFIQMSMRSRFENPINMGTVFLERHYKELEESFFIFFEDLLDFNFKIK